jgi:hypothetical protein
MNTPIELTPEEDLIGPGTYCFASARRTENIDRYLTHMLVLIRRDIMRVLTLFLDRHTLLPTSLSDLQEELSVNGSNAAPVASSIDSSLAPSVPSSSDDP